MKDKFRELAEQAGFVCWQNDEHWKPEGETIDWASADEKSFVNFSEMLISYSLLDFYRNYFDLNINEDITDQIKNYINDTFGENNE